MQISRALDSMPPRHRTVFTVMAVSEVTSMPDLLDLVRSERADHPDVAVFITLDDLDQALYTSMHATESDELEIDAGDSDTDEAGERRQFDHTSAQLAGPELRVTLAELRDSRKGSADDIDILAAINADPVAVLDDVVLVMRVPADDATAAIAALPNGYFDGDWNVFQIHAVTRHLANAYGYRPLGIGASWIGFVRDAPLLTDDAARLVADLKDLYGAPEAAGWPRLEAALTRQSTLFLGYTDNFAE